MSEWNEKKKFGLDCPKLIAHTHALSQKEQPKMIVINCQHSHD